MVSLYIYAPYFAAPALRFLAARSISLITYVPILYLPLFFYLPAALSFANMACWQRCFSGFSTFSVALLCALWHTLTSIPVVRFLPPRRSRQTTGTSMLGILPHLLTTSHTLPLWRGGMHFSTYSSPSNCLAFFCLSLPAAAGALLSALKHGRPAAHCMPAKRCA